MDAPAQTRRRIPSLTEIRAERLRHSITLAEVALRANLSSYRVSLVERDPSRARPGELEALHRAIDELSAEMSKPAAVSTDDVTALADLLEERAG